MKHLLFILFACLTLLVLPFSASASAQPLAQFSFPGLNTIQLTPEQKAAVDQLETEIIPQIEEQLRPDQLDAFRLQIEEGKSFRKAFKSLTLAPDQKKSLASLIKTLPKSDAFATLTPDQKRAYFLSHKTLFKPTPEQIAERIKEGAEAKGTGMPSIEAITEKIKAGMSAKGGPSGEAIAEKIKAGMNAKGSYAPSAEEIAEKINMGMKNKELYRPKLEAIGEKITDAVKSFTQPGE